MFIFCFYLVAKSLMLHLMTHHDTYLSTYQRAKQCILSIHKNYSCYVAAVCFCDLRRKTNNLDIKGGINLIFSVCLLQSLHVEAWSCRVNRVGSSFTECKANIYIISAFMFKAPKNIKQTCRNMAYCMSKGRRCSPSCENI